MSGRVPPVSMKSVAPSDVNSGTSNAARTHTVGNCAQVGLVVAIAAVFVFDLHHEYRAAMRDLQRRKAGHQVVKEAIDRLHIRRVQAAQTDARLFKQPPRQRAEFPFGADVWAGTHNRIQPQPLRDAQKLDYIQHVVVYKFVLGGLMRVPRDVGFNSVETARLELQKAIFPVLARHAEVMYRARDYAHRLIV